MYAPPPIANDGVAATWTILATGAEGIDPTTWLIYNVGSIGLVFALMVSGVLKTKWEVQGLERAWDKERDELKSRVDGLEARLLQRDKLAEGLLQQLTGSTIPALNRQAQVFEQLPHQLPQLPAPEVQTELHETTEALKQLTRLLQPLIQQEEG